MVNQSIATEPMVRNGVSGVLTCPVCGRTDADVVEFTAHCGGRGYLPVVQCLDQVACWRRRDIAEALQALVERLAMRLDDVERKIRRLSITVEHMLAQADGQW